MAVIGSPVMHPETPRLLLRRFRNDDLDVLSQLNADPDVMRYILDGSPLDQEQTVAPFAAMAPHCEERRFGLLAIEIRESWLGRAGDAPLSARGDAFGRTTQQTQPERATLRPRPRNRSPSPL